MLRKLGEMEIVVRNRGLGLRLKPQVQHLLVCCSMLLDGGINSPSLTFLICKMGTAVV